MFSGSPGVRLESMTFDQVCEKIVVSLEMSRVVSKAVDPVARSFSMGRVSGLEEALRILQAEQAVRIKGAAHERICAAGSER
jgi:hypothetical protein